VIVRLSENIYNCLSSWRGPEARSSEQVSWRFFGRGHWQMLSGASYFLVVGEASSVTRAIEDRALLLAPRAKTLASLRSHGFFSISE
jgi:hypothetical protein